MYNNKTVSAVLFVYNEQDYIGETIESILNQTVCVDEIVVVDDFSTDRTKEIIDQYKKEYQQIKYFLNTKKGKIYAYQNGLKNVTSDYFFVFGGDDVLMENYVSEMITLLDQKKIDYAYANYIMTDSELKPISYEKKKEFYSCREILDQNYGSGSIFGKKAIINQITPLPDGLLFEDWYTGIKLSYLYGYNYISQSPLVYYRRHSKASTASFNTKEKYFFHLERHIKLFEKILEEGFIIDNNLILVIKSKLNYLQTLRNYSFFGGVRQVLNNNLSLKERIKLILFPFYFGLKYK
jgi:glycosyltransferase involved in cell wall biosynthesis